MTMVKSEHSNLIYTKRQCQWYDNAAMMLAIMF